MYYGCVWREELSCAHLNNSQDENKEKGYTSLDKLAKRLKEIGVEVFAIALTDNQN